MVKTRNFEQPMLHRRQDLSYVDHVDSFFLYEPISANKPFEAYLIPGTK